jgi:hypothetical protein
VFGCDEHNVGYVKAMPYGKSLELGSQLRNTALVQVEGAILTLDKTGCWASSGHTSQGCAALEQALRDCMAVNVRNIAVQLLQFNKITGSRGLIFTLTETQGRQQEQDQLSPLPPVSSHQGPAQEELDATICTGSWQMRLIEIVWHHA